jgi:hypothetical protein
LEINSQASDLNINFDSKYSAKVKLNAKASTITVKIPKDLEARIKINSKVKNLSIDSRFINSNNEYKTSKYDKAIVKLDLQIDAVASSISIK